MDKLADIGIDVKDEFLSLENIEYWYFTLFAYIYKKNNNFKLLRYETNRFWKNRKHRRKIS
jgi:hypothetical protein